MTKETLSEVLRLRVKPSTLEALKEAADYRARTTSNLARVVIERFLDSPDDIIKAYWGGSLTSHEAAILFANAVKQQLYSSPAPSGGNGGESE